MIVDVERPEKPFIDQVFHDDLHDVNDVKIAATNASIFAYVADGEHGLAVLQLTSPEWTPAYAASVRGLRRGSSPGGIPKVRPWRCRKGWIATAPSTKAAISSPSSTASAPVR